MPKNLITVKLLSKGSRRKGAKTSSNHAFPSATPQWGTCRFVFGDEEEYDWLVVYDELPGTEVLRCPQKHTLLVTTEPSSIKTYERCYLNQFGYVLTGQEDWALKHPGKIHSQPALSWFYGRNKAKSRSYDEISQNIPDQKTRVISTVTSTKKQKHTLHHQRFTFIQSLSTKIPELERFGKGIREVDDKAEALDPYKYHIAVENHICDHWWTEKLSDSFLGLTLPFYSGAPNAADYFPPESFIPIDIQDVEGSARIIKQAIENNEYEKRLPAIKEARKLVLEKYNLFATVSQIIEERHEPETMPAKPIEILTRHDLRRNPITAVSVALEKTKMRLRTILLNISPAFRTKK